MPSRSSKAVAARAARKPVRRRKDGSRSVRYSEALAREICERIGRGEIWSRISGTDGMPEYSTLFQWRRKPEFAEAFALARAAATETRGPLHDQASHGADAFGEFAANRGGGAAVRRPARARLSQPLGWMG